MAEQLLDREKETKAILDILNKSADDNKIIYLTGISGVGKPVLLKNFHKVHYLLIKFYLLKSVKVPSKQLKTYSILMHYTRRLQIMPKIKYLIQFYLLHSKMQKASGISGEFWSAYLKVNQGYQIWSLYQSQRRMQEL